MQTAVNVISKNGKRLMPTFRFGKVRHMLKSGQAVIVKHEPFTIQLTYDTPEKVQEIEICVDAGYENCLSVDFPQCKAFRRFFIVCDRCR